jgi:hypothetical protein
LLQITFGAGGVSCIETIADLRESKFCIQPAGVFNYSPVSSVNRSDPTRVEEIPQESVYHSVQSVKRPSQHALYGWVSNGGQVPRL